MLKYALETYSQQAATILLVIDMRLVKSQLNWQATDLENQDRLKLVFELFSMSLLASNFHGIEGILHNPCYHEQ